MIIPLCINWEICREGNHASVQFDMLREDYCEVLRGGLIYTHSTEAEMEKSCQKRAAV